MKEMTPKERVMAFFRHEPVDELPTDEGIFVLFNPEAYKERPSHEHGGVDWFGVPWKYESSVDAIAPDHSVEPIMEDICDWRELVKFRIWMHGTGPKLKRLITSVRLTVRTKYLRSCL